MAQYVVQIVSAPGAGYKVRVSGGPKRGAYVVMLAQDTSKKAEQRARAIGVAVANAIGWVTDTRSAVLGVVLTKSGDVWEYPERATVIVSGKKETPQ